MTGEEKIVVAIGVVGIGAIIGYLLWEEKKKPTTTVVALQGAAAGSAQPRPGSSFSSVGNAIAGLGGAAVAHLGKEASGWLESRISGAFA